MKWSILRMERLSQRTRDEWMKAAPSQRSREMPVAASDRGPTLLAMTEEA
jgi:hypothetical protein